MLALLQVVDYAKVTVDAKVSGTIERGLLVFLGIEGNDNEQTAARLAERTLNYRLFPDDKDKINLSVKDIGGGVLIVPQFTLAADTKNGLRPNFSTAKAPQESKILFDYFVKEAEKMYPKIAQGEFGANMLVTLCNHGPITFLLQG